jgi:hypothetical protein
MAAVCGTGHFYLMVDRMQTDWQRLEIRHPRTSWIFAFEVARIIGLSHQAWPF